MLIKCNECGKEISDKAMTCPHCGVPINQQNIVAEQRQREVIKTTLLDICCVISMVFCLFFSFVPNLMALIGIIIPIVWYILYTTKDSKLSKNTDLNTKHLTIMRVIIIVWLILDILIAMGMLMKITFR